MNTLPDRLLACPFCGSEAEVDSYDDRTGTFVQCCNCFARVNGGSVEWNTRTPAAALSGREAVAWRVPLKDGGWSYVARKPAWFLGAEPLFTTPQPGDGVVVPDAKPDLWAKCGDTYVGDISAQMEAAENDGWNACRAAMIAAAPSAKGVAPVESKHAHAMEFYGVESVDGLIAAQSEHVQRLQAKLPKDSQPAVAHRVRKG